MKKIKLLFLCLSPLLFLSCTKDKLDNYIHGSWRGTYSSDIYSTHYNYIFYYDNTFEVSTEEYTNGGLVDYYKGSGTYLIGGNSVYCTSSDSDSYVFVYDENSKTLVLDDIVFRKD